MKIKDVSEETLRNYLKELDRSLELSDDLKVTLYQNGDPIPKAQSGEQWREFGKKEIGAYCINKDGDYLYNWYAVDDSRKLAPEGWRIPSDEEWDRVEIENPKYPGYRGSYNGNYYDMGYYGYFWSSTESSSYYAWYRVLYYYGSGVYRYSYCKQDGLSVRCVREIK